MKPFKSLKKILQNLFLLFFLFIFTGKTFAAPPPPVHQANVSHSENAVSELKWFLFDLYNNLVEQEYLAAEKLHSPGDIWRQNLIEFENALGRATLGKGAFVTSRYLYDSEQSAAVLVDENNRLYLHFLSPDQTVQIGKRYGLIGCQIHQVNMETPDLAYVISQNTQCLYANYLQNAYAQAPPDTVFDYEFINQSGVENYLSAYLNNLSVNGLITSFSIEPQEEIISFVASDQAIGVKGVTFHISPGMVNTLSANDEAVGIEINLNDIKMDVFIYVNESWGKAPTFIPRVDFDRALQAVIKQTNSSPSQKEETFLETYGYSEPASQRTPTDPPIHYPSGVVTPANNIILEFIGAQENALAISPILSQLSTYGYQIRKLDCRNAGRDGCFDPFVVDLFKKAQTMILEVHGAANGTFGAMCYPDIPYGNRCCLKLRHLAELFGLPTTRLNCSGPGPYQDDTGSIVASSTGSQTCGGDSAGSYDENYDQTNRCRIDFTPILYASLGEKAAVFSSQCYGGGPLCGAYNNVKDFMAFPIPQLHVFHARYDAKIIIEDLLGNVQRYLTCLPAAPTNPTSPFCVSPPADAIIGFNFRNIQSSIALRGTHFRMDSTSCENHYNPRDGSTQYCAAIETGDPRTAVEFAPAVDSAVFANVNGPVFLTLFTSAVKPFVGSMTAELHGKAQFAGQGEGPNHVYAKNSLYGNMAINHFGAALQFNPSIPFMDETEWMTSPRSDMLQKYGASQGDGWPWYIEVTLSGVEANWPDSTVKLDGNATADNKWLWPYSGGPTVSVGPWSNINAKAANGDPFKIKIPVRPHFVCCMPNLEVNEANYTFQNGCTCTEILTLHQWDLNRRRWVSTCEAYGLPGTVNEGQSFPGVVRRDFYSCCGGPICDPEGECPPLQPGECRTSVFERYNCPVPDYPPGTRYTDTNYQFHEWPVDENENVEQCSTIHGRCVNPEN